ncbi:hypothetical protein [Paenibacillus cymbidii]|nr:hypothetical protein [Paenibacillus cymbidii]
MREISHVLLAISPKTAGRREIASEIAGYFCETNDFVAVGGK